MEFCIRINKESCALCRMIMSSLLLYFYSGKLRRNLIIVFSLTYFGLFFAASVNTELSWSILLLIVMYPLMVFPLVTAKTILRYRYRNYRCFDVCYKFSDNNVAICLEADPVCYGRPFSIRTSMDTKDIVRIIERTGVIIILHKSVSLCFWRRCLSSQDWLRVRSWVKNLSLSEKGKGV